MIDVNTPAAGPGTDDQTPVDPRVARTHADVSEAVRELFVEEGWDAITHQRVAERAGYGRNTVYRHFPDRTSLLLHGGHFDDVHHAPITGDLRTDLVAELCAFRRELFEGILGRIMTAMAERAELDPEVEPVWEQLVDAGTRQTHRLVRKAVADERMDGGISDALHIANLCGPILYARLCQRTQPDDDAIEHLVDAHLTGPSR